MASPIIWASASRLKAWYACPRRQKLEKFVETPAMRAGTERHALIELLYRRQDLAMDPTVVSAFSEECRAIVFKANERGLLPPHDQVVSCEAADIPDEFKYEAYGRKMFAVAAGSGRPRPWGVRGAADLAFLADGDDDTLWLADWKGRTQDDGEIQGSVYALAYWTMFPGFKRYVFQQRSLTLSWPHDPYEFLADDMPKVAAFIEELIYRMTDDTTFEPRENRWCSSCAVQVGCSVWEKATSAPIVESLPAVKAFNLPMEFGPLLELKERAANYERIAEALKDRCQDELLKILAHGPVKENGHTYVKGTGTSGYKVKDGRLGEIIQAIEKTGGVPADFFVLDTPRVREALDKAKKKSVVNAEQDAIKAVIQDCFEASTYAKIVKKAGG